MLELGAGTGRVALDLAARGHEVVALDRDPELLAALAERSDGLPLETAIADARQFELGRRFALVLAPMQLLQLFGGAAERIACLRCVAAHLAPGGRAAAAIADDLEPSAGAPAPLPDAREERGRVHSSLPLETLIGPDRIVVRRLRQTVDPDGGLTESVNEIELRRLAAAEVEREAEAAGLAAEERRPVPPTEDHVGSTVVLLRGEG